MILTSTRLFIFWSYFFDYFKRIYGHFHWCWASLKKRQYKCLHLVPPSCVWFYCTICTFHSHFIYTEFYTFNFKDRFGSRIVLHVRIYVCIYLVNFTNLLVGCIIWPALCVLRHCVFRPALGWLIIHPYILSRYI